MCFPVRSFACSQDHASAAITLEEQYPMSYVVLEWLQKKQGSSDVNCISNQDTHIERVQCLLHWDLLLQYSSRF